jgi:hypothetical protein
MFTGGDHSIMKAPRISVLSLLLLATGVPLWLMLYAEWYKAHFAAFDAFPNPILLPLSAFVIHDYLKSLRDGWGIAIFLAGLFWLFIVFLDRTFSY